MEKKSKYFVKRINHKHTHTATSDCLHRRRREILTNGRKSTNFKMNGLKYSIRLFSVDIYNGQSFEVFFIIFFSKFKLETLARIKGANAVKFDSLMLDRLARRSRQTSHRLWRWMWWTMKQDLGADGQRKRVERIELLTLLTLSFFASWRDVHVCCLDF